MNTLKQALEIVYLHCLLRLFPAALGFNPPTFQPANKKNKQTKHILLLRRVTIQSSCDSSSPQLLLWISGSRCSRIQQRKLRWCLWLYGQGPGTAPEGTDVMSSSPQMTVQHIPNISSNGVTPYLPPHENIVRVFQIFIVEIIWVECLCILVESLELALDTESKKRIISQWSSHL